MHQNFKTPAMLLKVVLAGSICHVVPAFAQDPPDVVILKKQTGDGETKRKGEIVGWSGDVISIRGRTGLKEIDTERLDRIETARHPGLLEGNRLLESYQYDAAIEQFLSAMESERRPWMQNVICSRLTVSHMAKEEFGKAANFYLKVIDDDPQSRFRNLVPLVWTSSRPGKRELRNAESWLDSNEPMISLLGASWLLSDRTNEKAKAKMEFLANDFDPLIASLAKIQLWRLDSMPVNEKRLAIRIKQTQSMPENVRSGAWYLIAQTQIKLNQQDEAIINFMRIPINDPLQGSLAAAALYQSAWLLDNTDRKGQAQVLRNELKEKFGDTVWAN